MKTNNIYKRFRFPHQIISHAVWLYHRFALSFRDIEDLLAKHGVIVSYETIRQWCIKFPKYYTCQLKRRQGKLGDRWFLDEVYIKIRGELHYLWRAVDQDGDELGILVQKHKDKQAAMVFFKKLFKSQQSIPNEIITDKLASYRAALNELSPSTPHNTQQYANNRAEVSHQLTRLKEKQMRRFKSHGHAQRLLSFFGLVRNLFRCQRHMLAAKNYRTLRNRSFATWQVCCAC